MDSSPRIFFSYSLTKSADADLVSNVINRLKQKIESRKWRIEDPMLPDINSIRDKVEKSLWRADAAIVEITTNSPNVMFEAGLARALSYPCVFLINMGAHSDIHLKKYFEFLNLDPNNPIAADLGDIEYLCYPSDSEDKNEWDRFEEKADKILLVLESLLSPEALLVKRSAKEILYQSTSFVAAHSNTHPIIGFLGGRLSMLARGFNVHGPNVFQMEAKHYYGSLIAYFASQSAQSLQVRAIADRSSNVEKFWEKSLDPLKTSVAERLFLVDWKVFFRQEQFEKLHQLLQAQTIHNYSVRLGVKSEAILDLHVFGENAIGQDLLLVEPDLIGGYIKDTSGDMLRVEKNVHLYREGVERYQSIRQKTLTVRHGMSVAELKRAWLDLSDIGRWNLEWGEPDTRDNSYFDHYDQHIRCWIPNYENLLKHCAVLAQEAISQRMRHKNESIRVCEIGYGTGELSESLMSWMNNLNAPVETLHRAPIIDAFLGIDSARRMQQIVNRRFTNRRTYQIFDVCNAPTWSRTVKEYAPFDVICGSLVLHDMVAGNVMDMMSNFLKKLTPIMANNGLVIFADVFLSDDQKIRSEQLVKWRKYMRQVGLNEKEVDDFFLGNPELVDTLTKAKIEAVIGNEGFEMIELSPIPGSSESSPLRVLVLQKN